MLNEDIKEDINDRSLLLIIAAFERQRLTSKTRNLLKYYNIILLPSNHMCLVTLNDNKHLFVFLNIRRSFQKTNLYNLIELYTDNQKFSFLFM